MNEVDDGLIARSFAAHASDVDDSDWLDVQRRSRSHRRGRLVLVVAVVVVIGALVVTPALGLRSAILDLFGRDDVQFTETPHATSVVKREFGEMSVGAPRGMDPKVVPGETRLAGTFEFGGVRRRVWVAPTMTGSFCYVLEKISGGCRSPLVVRSAIELDGGFVLRPGETEPALDVLAGKVFSSTATTLVVTFEDGKRISLPFIYVSPPINAGFFAYKPTAVQQEVGHRPAELLLLDEEGQAMGRRKFDWVELARDAKRKREVFERAVEEQANPRP
jgi:hypothetical protein